MSECV